MLWAWVVFWLSAAGLFYVLAGYPLLLFLVARVRARPVRERYEARPVTALLPVFNGELWIRQKLESLLALDYPKELLEILVISDGSADGTDGIVQQYADRGVALLRVPHGGKALALNAAIERARGEFLFFTDVRQTLEPSSLRELVSVLGDPEVGVVSGELIIRDGTTHEEVSTGLYWKYEKWIRRQMSRVDSVTGATGCIFLMRRSLAQPMPAGTILDDVYLPLLAIFAGYRAVWTDRAKAYDYPAPRQVEYRRKVRTQAGIYQVIRLLPRTLNPMTNRIWFHFVSHRLGRLGLPWMLGAILVSSAWLTAPWNGILLGAQAAFYGLAAVDPWIGERFFLKRLTSVIRTFVSLIAAALVATTILFRPGKSFWTVTRIGSAAR